MVAVALGEQGADLHSEDPLERDRGSLDQCDLDSEGHGRRRHLGADEAGPDDDEPAPRAELLAERQSIVERAQDVDALEAGDPARGRARGDDDRIRVHVVEPFDPRAEPQVDPELRPVLDRAQRDLVARAGKQLLRERRTLVRRV